MIFLDVEKIDVLINNAGIAFHPAIKTEEGFELHFVTNYLGNKISDKKRLKSFFFYIN